MQRNFSNSGEEEHHFYVWRKTKKKDNNRDIKSDNDWNGIDKFMCTDRALLHAMDRVERLLILPKRRPKSETQVRVMELDWRGM